MKLALLLPGYIESPDYHHLMVIEKKLKDLGYIVHRVDPCGLWETGDVSHYTVTNYLNQVNDLIDTYHIQNPEKTVLVGHSLGGAIAALVGSKNSSVTSVVCLSPQVSFEKSDEKWSSGVRTSKKDLPNNPQEFREFSIPQEFIKDRRQYSVVTALKSFTKPLMIMIALEDKNKAEIEEAAKVANNSYIVRIPDMGHDFRQSDPQCQLVAEEIKKFITE